MKTILIKSTFRNHNFFQLIEYYNNNLKNEYGKKIKIIHHQNTFNSKYSIGRFMFKMWMRIRRFFPYDLVISDFYSPLVYKTGKKTMYIFHGALTKNHPSITGLNNKTRLNYHRGLRRDTDYIITLHDTDQKYYLRHPLLEDIRLPEYLPLGLPRNDLLFNQSYIETSKTKIKNQFMPKGSRIAIFAPTFRDYEINQILNIRKDQIIALNSLLKHYDVTLIYRPHYFSGILKKEYLDGMSNIITIDSKAEGDTQKLLCCCDILITDYSSIFIDFMILNRPVLFFPFDLEEYKKTNGLTIDFNNPIDIPGKIAFTWDQLLNHLQFILENNEWENNYSKSIKRYFKYYDSNSSMRIWNLITNEIIWQL